MATTPERLSVWNVLDSLRDAPKNTTSAVYLIAVLQQLAQRT
jgi:hypothetical protein